MPSEGVWNHGKPCFWVMLVPVWSHTSNHISYLHLWMPPSYSVLDWNYHLNEHKERHMKEETEEAPYLVGNKADENKGVTSQVFDWKKAVSLSFGYCVKGPSRRKERKQRQRGTRSGWDVQTSTGCMENRSWSMTWLHLIGAHIRMRQTSTSMCFIFYQWWIMVWRYKWTSGVGRDRC